MSTIKTNKLVHTANGASEFTLPTADGSNGQALQTNGSGTLSFGSAGLFSSYAILADVKANSTNGGTFTAGAWRTRDLNTEIADPDGIVSISTDSFCLARVTISGSKTFEIQHYAAITSATYGFGVSGNMGNSMIYTTVEIYKEA